MDSVEAFYEWTFDIRGDGTCVVSNKPVGHDDDAVANAVIWTDDDIDVPDEVEVVNETIADGEAPAVKDKGVEGHTKYVVEYDP